MFVNAHSLTDFGPQLLRGRGGGGGVSRPKFFENFRGRDDRSNGLKRFVQEIVLRTAEGAIIPPTMPFVGYPTTAKK